MSEIIEARIEKLVYGGDALARVDGLAVFVPYGAPGDLLRLRIVERKKGFARAEIVEVLEPGPSRRTPPCPYFGPCGGCQIQQVEYAAQLEAKESFVRDALSRIARVEAPEAFRLHAAPDREFGYRIRTTAHVVHARAETIFGYYGPRSHRIVDVESCPLLVDELDAAWRAAREARETLSRVRDLDIAVGDASAAAEPPIAQIGGGRLETHAAGATYAFSPAVFFQANRYLLDALVRTATEGEKRGALARGALALDLYAGVGLFAVPLARRFERVVAVEGDGAAAALAAENARANGADGLEVVVAPVEEWLESDDVEPGGIDLALLDPPRSGLGEAASRRLATLEPGEIVYVSCDPSTLARDLRVLSDAGYSLDAVDVFDLFPQTFHVETVARLSRSGARD
jgi:23S rRNA (uracil1939-C5)-methyltransferase